MTNALPPTQTEAGARISFFRSLRGTLLLLFLAVALIPLITVGLLAYLQAQQALETEATNKLVAVRDIKADQIETYFATIEGQVRTLSKDLMIIQAMGDFKQSFHSLDEDLDLDSPEIQRRETVVRGYYQSEYLARLNPNLDAPASVGTYWPADVNTRLAQYLYLANNPNPTGSKENLDDAGDGSRYSQHHRTYHPIIRDYLREFGYYDIFLVDSETGHIVYTVFKEVDYTTSLLTGPYKNTNFARAFQAANAATDPDFVYLADFEPYHPSYNAPASFIASPIFDGNQKVGVLLFQMPIDRINAIMQERAGMGDSGETYLVGEDKLWRSDSRFLDDLGVESTILNEDFRADTVAAQEALADESGAQVIDDYRGVPVLSAYKPLNIKGVTWVILAEINEAEAFAPAQQMLIVMLVIMGVGALIVAGVAFFVANSLAKPVQIVTEVARKLAVGNVNQSVEVKSRNEIGLMAAAFRKMIAYQQQMAGAANRLAQGNVTADVTPQSEEDVLGHAFTRMIAYQQQIAGAADHLSQGDVTVDVTPQSEKDALGNAFSQMVTYQQQMAGAAGRLAQGDVAIEVTPQSEKDMLGHAFTRMIVYQQQMASTADRLAQGDLTTDVTPQSEKDVLGNAFSRMITNLRNLVGRTQQNANQVAGASQQLNASAEQASQASQQVTITIQQVAEGTNQQTHSIIEATGNVDQTARAADGIATGAQEQAREIQKTSTLIDEMTNIVDQVGQAANSVTEGNARVTQAARHGVTAVEQTNQGMEKIRTRTASAAEKVKEMGNRSKEIGRIVETIDDIADKTDMLALNAAVEAARAGEHGRGFAVVADQVRKLSEDSKEATRDITQLIERVQETVSEAIAAMDSTAAEVDNGTRLAGDTAQSLQDILQAAEEAVDLAKRINQAVAQLKQKSENVVATVESVSAVVEENTAVAEEMAAGSQETLTAMGNVASIAEENSASAEEVSASAEEMAAQVEEMVASAEELATLAEDLHNATAQFQVAKAGQVKKNSVQ